MKLITFLCVLLLAAGLAGCIDDAPPPPAEEVEPTIPDEALDNFKMLELGTRLHKQHACVACHSLDGTKLAGASYLGLFGTTAELTDGTEVVRDENYMRLSILDPGAQIVKGYVNAMPNYTGKLTPEEVDALVFLIKSLEKPAGEAAPEGAAP